jgi:hypothetical protein
MKRLLASLALIAAASALSGCYYDPGYSYVRGSGYSGDAYYGEGGNAYYTAPGYYDGYYGSGYYGDGYYGYSPGVSIGISSGWYGGSRYRHDGYRGGYRDYDRHAGQWQGRRDGDGRSHGGRSDQGHWSHGQGQPSGGHARGGNDGSRGGGRGRGGNSDRHD